MVAAARAHGSVVRGDVTTLPVADGSVDAEDAAGIVACAFGAVTVEAWDAPLMTLPDRDAVRDYLRTRFVPPDEAGRLAEALAARGPLPCPSRKRGALLMARR
jgi:hypothetical protein